MDEEGGLSTAAFLEIKALWLLFSAFCFPPSSSCRTGISRRCV
jgi:hypothetical protein